MCRVNLKILTLVSYNDDDVKFPAFVASEDFIYLRIYLYISTAVRYKCCSYLIDLDRYLAASI